MTHPDLKAIATNPKPYGFEWTLSPLEHKDVVVCQNAPHVHVLDVAKFIATFGDERVSRWLNGTALRVETQRVVRDTCAANPNIRSKTDDLKLLVVETMFGIKAARVTVITETVVVKKFLANDGETEFDSLEDVKTFNRMLAEAEDRIANSPDNQQA